jgi:hypothetical protein
MKIKRNSLLGIVALCMVLIFAGSASAEIPPTPVSLTVDVSGGWVNYTWAAGSGNVTDGYNTSISVSGGALTWTNSTATTSNNNVGLDNWAEIWVYAYNDTGSGNFSTTYAYLDTQADRSRFGELIDLMNAIPDVLTPILAIIVIIVVIMAFMTVGYMITGTVDGIGEALKNALRFKK